METHAYYFDFKSIMNTKEDITTTEEIFAEMYLQDLIVKVDEDDEIYPLTAETIKYWVVHIVRYHNELK